MIDRIVLGVDPGIASTGFALIRANGLAYEHVCTGVCLTGSDTDRASRLLEIVNTALDYINHYTIDAVSIEQVFHNKNVSSSISTASVIGAIMVTAAAYKIPVVSPTPQQAKQAVGCFGTADKDSVRLNVNSILKRPMQQQLRNAHVCDAVAIAIAGHLHLRGKYKNLS